MGRGRRWSVVGGLEVVIVEWVSDGVGGPVRRWWGDGVICGGGGRVGYLAWDGDDGLGWVVRGGGGGMGWVVDGRVLCSPRWVRWMLVMVSGWNGPGWCCRWSALGWWVWYGDCGVMVVSDGACRGAFVWDGGYWGGEGGCGGLRRCVSEVRPGAWFGMVGATVSGGGIPCWGCVSHLVKDWSSSSQT